MRVHWGVSSNTGDMSEHACGTPDVLRAAQRSPPTPLERIQTYSAAYPKQVPEFRAEFSKNPPKRRFPKSRPVLSIKIADVCSRSSSTIADVAQREERYGRRWHAPACAQCPRRLPNAFTLTTRTPELVESILTRQILFGQKIDNIHRNQFLDQKTLYIVMFLFDNP